MLHATWGSVRRQLASSVVNSLSVLVGGTPTFRWNPDSDEKPKYASYQIDINSCGPMMLDALFKIKDEKDQSLAFRRSCR